MPNLLTVARVLSAPLVGFLLADGRLPILAALLFILAALTDFADGWLARRWRQQSTFGAMLDPVADKAMVTCAFFGLAGQGMASTILFTLPALVILLREALIAGLREFLGTIRLSVTVVAKWKTTAQLFALGGLILSSDHNLSFLYPVSMILLWVAALLTLWSGADYLRKALPYFGTIKIP